MIKGKMIYNAIQQVEIEISELNKALAYLEDSVGKYSLPYVMIREKLTEKWNDLVDFEDREFEEVKREGSNEQPNR